MTELAGVPAAAASTGDLIELERVFRIQRRWSNNSDDGYAEARFTTGSAVGPTGQTARPSVLVRQMTPHPTYA